MVKLHLQAFWQNFEYGKYKVLVSIYKNFKNRFVTLTVTVQCQMSNSSEQFPYTTICKSFKLTAPLFFEFSCAQTYTHGWKDRQMDRQTEISTL